ncbi:MAG: glycosyltransferase family 4 protein [Pseudomonadota bacterium]
MKITFVAPYNISGGVRVVAIYAEKLRARGHDVRIVSRLKPHLSWPRHILAQLQGRRVRPRARAAHYGALEPFVTKIETTRPLTDDDFPDADVVIATWWETAFWVDALAPEKGAKVYFVQHHETHGSTQWEFARGSYYLPLQKITISGWLEGLMADLYGDRDVRVVPNSVSLDQFHGPPRGKQARPTVGFMYSRKEFKGADVAAEAVRQLKARFPELRVVAFGQSPLDANAGFPADTDYTQTPPQEAIREIYAAADVWLVSSHTEGFGLPALEAMACRTPVVSTRVGGPAEFIRDGENGHLVAPGDATALADRAAELLVAEEPAWRAVSDAAHASVTGYTWDDAAERFEQALNDAVAARQTTQ